MEMRDLNAQYNLYKNEIASAMHRVLESGSFIGGNEVNILEKRLAEYAGVKHCISCANGTEAMSLAMMAWDIKEGDAVFVPDFTFFSTGEVVCLRERFLDLVNGGAVGRPCLRGRRHRFPLLDQRVAYAGPIPQPEEADKQQHQHGNRQGDSPQTLEIESAKRGQFRQRNRQLRCLIGRKCWILQGLALNRKTCRRPE
jgi:hypothetical protein